MEIIRETAILDPNIFKKFIFLVLLEKTTSVTNAKNTFETELRRKISEIENRLRKEQVRTLIGR